jgi:hypothetical protein
VANFVAPEHHFFFMAPCFSAAAAAAAVLLANGASAARDASACYQQLIPGDSSCMANATPRDMDFCFLRCVVCYTSALAVGVDPDVYPAACAYTTDYQNRSTILPFVTNVLFNVSSMHGYQWLDDAGDYEMNKTEALTSLLAGMPRRDMILLESNPFLTLDFLLETLRHALMAWPFSASLGTPWPVFLDSVLPYSMLDEKRDLWWRWRPRFAQIFGPVVAGSANATEAMHRLAVAIPLAETNGALFLAGAGGTQQPAPGIPITWHSSVSPAFISPQQVASFGGSCTGTGIVLVAAARSVGVAARLAGCSESVVRGDDHHWAEYFDATSPGPFGDYWHTKEGESAGNTGGPWDSPSGPMLGCLQGVVPGSNVDTLWAATWGSDTYLPALWSNNTWAQTWAWVGGTNVCGRYCQAWGCSVNNSMKWTQEECGPTA